MEIWQEIMSVVISNGVFAVLFVLLFLYQLKDSKQREAKYQQTIDELSKHIGVVHEIKEDVAELKSAMIKKKRGKNETEKID